MLAAATLAVAGIFVARRAGVWGAGKTPGPTTGTQFQAQVQEQAANRAELRGIRREMEEIEAKTRTAFLDYARGHASRARSELAALRGEIATAQAEVATVLGRSATDLDRFVAMRSNANFDCLAEAHELAGDRLARIATLQEQVLGMLSLCTDAEPAIRAQQAAMEGQARAAGILKKLEEARGIARGSRQRSPQEQQYEHFTYHLARAERRIAEKPGELEAFEQRQETLNGMIAEVAQSIANSSTEDRPRLESQLAVLRGEGDAVQDKAKAADKQLADARKNLEKLQARVAEIETALTAQPQPATSADQTLRTLHAALEEAQREAAKLQEAAGLPETTRVLAEPQLFAALHGEDATDDGAAIAAAFHRVRAMELAMERRIPLEKAFAMADLAPKSGASPASARAMLEQARGGERPAFLLDKIENDERVVDLSGQPAPEILLPGGPGGPPLLPEPPKIPALSATPMALPDGLGPARPWVFVDRWQVLGPFDNPRRENLETRFPPETVVDPEAAYPGKNGVTIAWEACQSATPNTLPPFRAYNRVHRIEGLTEETSYLFNLQYTVYYASAEVRLEKEADLWLAIGSDDQSKVWLNDQLVWFGRKSAKPWRADEGFRKLHFRSGINRILYRIENGNDRTEFSLLLGSAHQ